MGRFGCHERQWPEKGMPSSPCARLDVPQRRQAADAFSRTRCTSTLQPPVTQVLANPEADGDVSVKLRPACLRDAVLTAHMSRFDGLQTKHSILYQRDPDGNAGDVMKDHRKHNIPAIPRVSEL